MLPASKRTRSPSPPPLLKKSKVDQECCAFCSVSKSLTKDEGELQLFKIRNKEFYVHEVCLLFSGRNSNETDQSVVKRVTGRPANYKCKADACACKKLNGATIGCCNKKCKQVFHYRCALNTGTMLPSGNFFCPRHKEMSKDLIEDTKASVNWPGEVPYLFENDWSDISREDRQLIGSSTAGWATWATMYNPCVKIVKVTHSHWAWAEDYPYDLQATELIRAEDAICELMGKLRKINVTKENPPQCSDVYVPTQQENKFMGTLTEGYTKKLIIDSSKSGNEGRYVNFLTDKAKEMNIAPNCYLSTQWSMGKLKVVLIAIKDIQPNESIVLVDDDSAFSSEGEKNKSPEHNGTSNKIKNQKKDQQKLFPILAWDDVDDGLGDSDEDENESENLASSYDPFDQEYDLNVDSPVAQANFPVIPEMFLPSPSSSSATLNSSTSTTTTSTTTTDPDNEEFHPVTIDHINHTTITHSISPRHTSPLPTTANSNNDNTPSTVTTPPSAPSYKHTPTSKSKSTKSNKSPPHSDSLTPNNKNNNDSNNNNNTPNNSRRYNTRNNYTPLAYLEQNGRSKDYAILSSHSSTSTSTSATSSSSSSNDTNSKTPPKLVINTKSNKNNTNGEKSPPRSTSISSSTSSTSTPSLSSTPTTPNAPNGGKKGKAANNKKQNSNNTTNNNNTETTNSTSTTAETNTNNNDINNNNNDNNKISDSNTNNNNNNSNDKNNNTSDKNNMNNNEKSIVKALTPPDLSPATLASMSVLGHIDSKIQSIIETYNIDILKEYNQHFDAAPVQFFYDLKKLDSECENALKQEEQEYQYAVETAKEMLQIYTKRMENAPTPEIKEKVKLDFANIESDLAKKEQNIIVHELRERHRRLRLNLLRALDVIDSLYTDIKLHVNVK